MAEKHFCQVGREAMIDLNDPRVDASTVRQFLEIICAHVAQTINGADRPGVLQLCRINPTDERNVVPSRFSVDDVEAMIDLAINDAKAGHNVYVEARTV